MSNTKKVEEKPNPTIGFSQRLSYFQREELGLGNGEAAELSGVSYPRFMAWLSSESLPMKVGDIHCFVDKALTLCKRGDVASEQVTAWLCFGDFVPNPFDRRPVPASVGGKLIVNVLLLMAYIEELASEEGVDAKALTRRKVELAVKTLAMSQHVMIQDGRVLVPETEKDLVVGILRL